MVKLAVGTVTTGASVEMPFLFFLFFSLFTFIFIYFASWGENFMLLEFFVGAWCSLELAVANLLEEVLVVCFSDGVNEFVCF